MYCRQCWTGYSGCADCCLGILLGFGVTSHNCVCDVTMVSLYHKHLELLLLLYYYCCCMLQLLSLSNLLRHLKCCLTLRLVYVYHMILWFVALSRYSQLFLCLPFRERVSYQSMLCCSCLHAMKYCYEIEQNLVCRLQMLHCEFTLSQAFCVCSVYCREPALNWHSLGK